MPDPENKNARFGILNPRDYTIVADPISPKFAEALALQRLAGRTWILKRGDSVAEKAKNTPGRL
jgi:hypothetical protein